MAVLSLIEEGDEGERKRQLRSLSTFSLSLTFHSHSPPSTHTHTHTHTRRAQRDAVCAVPGRVCHPRGGDPRVAAVVGRGRVLAARLPPGLRLAAHQVRGTKPRARWQCWESRSHVGSLLPAVGITSASSSTRSGPVSPPRPPSLPHFVQQQVLRAVAAMYKMAWAGQVHCEPRNVVRPGATRARHAHGARLSTQTADGTRRPRFLL